MVCIKQLIAATSLFLSGALAAPVTEHDLSVTTANIRARNVLGVEAREFNDASVVNIEARAKKAKKPVNSKTNAPKPSSSSAPKPSASSAALKPSGSSTSKATRSSVVSKTSSGSATKPPSASGSKATSASGTKTGSASSSKTLSASATKTASASSSSASGTKVSSSASACAKPTKSARSLKRREGPLRPATSQLDINEDLYVVNAKGKSVVTNLSGCTAIFLWDSNNVPSIFHILCGDETPKTARAMEIVNGNQFTTKAYSILANDPLRYNNVKKQIVDYAEGMEATKPKEIPLDLYKVDGSQKNGSDRLRWLTRARTESGSTYVLVDEVVNPNYNPSQTGGIC